MMSTSREDIPEQNEIISVPSTSLASIGANSKVGKLLRELQDNVTQKQIVLLLLEIAERPEICIDYEIKLSSYLNLFFQTNETINMSEAGHLISSAAKIYSRRVDNIYECIQNVISGMDKSIKDVEEGKKESPTKRKRILKRPRNEQDPLYEAELAPKQIKVVPLKKTTETLSPLNTFEPPKHFFKNWIKYREWREEHRKRTKCSTDSIFFDNSTALHPSLWKLSCIEDFDYEDDVDTKRDYRVFTNYMEHRQSTLVNDINFVMHFKVKDFIEAEEDEIEIMNHLGLPSPPKRKWPPICRINFNNDNGCTEKDSDNCQDVLYNNNDEDYINNYLKLENAAMKNYDDDSNSNCDSFDENNDELCENYQSISNQGKQCKNIENSNTNEGSNINNNNSNNLDMLSSENLQLQINLFSVKDVSNGTCNNSNNNPAEGNTVTNNSALTNNCDTSAVNEVNEPENSGVGLSINSNNGTENQQCPIESSLTLNNSSLSQNQSNQCEAAEKNGGDSVLGKIQSGDTTAQNNNSTNNSNSEPLTEIQTNSGIINGSLSIEVLNNNDNNEKDPIGDNLLKNVNESRLSLDSAIGNIDPQSAETSAKNSTIGSDSEKIIIRISVDEGVALGDLDEIDRALLNPVVELVDILQPIMTEVASPTDIVIKDEKPKFFPSNFLDIDPNLLTCKENFVLPAEIIIKKMDITENILKIPEHILRKRCIFKLPVEFDLFKKDRCKRKQAAEVQNRKEMKITTLNDITLKYLVMTPPPSPTLSEDFLGFPESIIGDVDHHHFEDETNIFSQPLSQDDPSANKPRLDSQDSGIGISLESAQINKTGDQTHSQNPSDSLLNISNLDQSTLGNSVLHSTAIQNINTGLSSGLESTLEKSNDYSLDVENLTAGNQLNELQPMRDQNGENQNTEKYDINTTIEKVKKWHRYLKPILQKSRERRHFDIYATGTEIINKFSENGRSEKEPISFQTVMKEKDPCDVSRYFLSTLLLTNQSNLSLSVVDFNLEEPVPFDKIQLTLKSKKRHTVSIEDDIGAPVAKRRRIQSADGNDDNETSITTPTIPSRIATTKTPRTTRITTTNQHKQNKSFRTDEEEEEEEEESYDNNLLLSQRNERAIEILQKYREANREILIKEVESHRDDYIRILSRKHDINLGLYFTEDEIQRLNMENNSERNFEEECIIYPKNVNIRQQNKSKNLDDSDSGFHSANISINSKSDVP